MNISGGKRRITSDVPPELWSDAWCSKGIAEQQAKLMATDLGTWRRGKPHAAFDAFGTLISDCNDCVEVLEVGCGCGVYADVCEYIDKNVNYFGVDISADMVAAAEKANKTASYEIMNATDLDFLDDTFDIVVLGSVIGHVEDWRKAISEARRVASKYLMIHRVGCYLNKSKPETISTKTAYGVEMAERFFDEKHLIDEVSLTLSRSPIHWPHAAIGWQASFLFDV